MSFCSSSRLCSGDIINTLYINQAVELSHQAQWIWSWLLAWIQRLCGFSAPWYISFSIAGKPHQLGARQRSWVGWITEDGSVYTFYQTTKKRWFSPNNAKIGNCHDTWNIFASITHPSNHFIIMLWHFFIHLTFIWWKLHKNKFFCDSEWIQKDTFMQCMLWHLKLKPMTLCLCYYTYIIVMYSIHFHKNIAWTSLGILY